MSEPNVFRSRFRRLTDLFVTGKEVLMPDGTYLWVQVINAFERDECQHDAQVAKARLTLALKDSGEERDKVRARYLESGRESLITDIVAAESSTKFAEFMEDMRDDPDWKERIEIVLRTDSDSTAKPLELPELQYLTKINREVIEELERREKDEREYLRKKYEAANDDEIIEIWEDNWLDKRGGEVANAEYRLTEMYYGTRDCSGKQLADGRVDHSGCEGHELRLFPTKADARSIPSNLAFIIQNAIADLQMVGRDPKGSGKRPSSSDSSPATNEPEESNPSTSREIHDVVPGI